MIADPRSWTVTFILCGIWIAGVALRRLNRYLAQHPRRRLR